MYNRLQKQAYFIKRLRDSGYNVERVFAGYSYGDARLWTIVINPKQASLHCTCYVNNGEAEGVDTEARCFFEVFDGGQFIPGRLKIDTNSIEIFISYLIKRGIEPVNTKPKPYQAKV